MFDCIRAFVRYAGAGRSKNVFHLITIGTQNFVDLEGTFPLGQQLTAVATAHNRRNFHQNEVPYGKNCRVAPMDIKALFLPLLILLSPKDYLFAEFCNINSISKQVRR